MFYITMQQEVLRNHKLWLTDNTTVDDDLPGVCQACTGLRQHLLFILLHVDRIRTSWLGLRVWVNLSRAQATWVVGWIVTILLADSHVQQLLIPVEALRGRAADNGCDRSPLAGHQLCQVKELLILLTGPFCFPDTGVQPLIPVCEVVSEVMGWEKAYRREVGRMESLAEIVVVGDTDSAVFLILIFGRYKQQMGGKFHQLIRTKPPIKNDTAGNGK